MKHRDLDRKHREQKRSWRRLRMQRDDTETTRQYTPKDLQAMTYTRNNGAGVIRPDTGQLHLPSGIEDFEEGQQSDSPPRVMSVIVALALVVIAVITYFVSRMPQKD
jgi:hypothetical protein